MSPALLDFGTVDLGSASVAHLVTVTVTGGGNGVEIVPTVIGVGFAVSSTTCANPQSPGSVCTRRPMAERRA